MINGFGTTVGLFSAIGGGLVAIGIWVGTIQADVQSNSKALEERRQLVSKIPLIEASLIDIQGNQRKILCKLGEAHFCDGGGR